MLLIETITLAVRRNAIRECVDLSLHSNLLQLGVLDSLGILAVVADVEQELDCKIAPETILPENFSTLAGMVNLFHQFAGVNNECG